MTTDLTSADTVVRRNDIPATPVDGDLVILSFATGNYIGLDEIGRRIWDGIESPIRIDDLCRELTESYRAPADQIERDVLVFLREMVAEKLVDVVV